MNDQNDKIFCKKSVDIQTSSPLVFQNHRESLKLENVEFFSLKNTNLGLSKYLMG